MGHHSGFSKSYCKTLSCIDSTCSWGAIICPILSVHMWGKYHQQAAAVLLVAATIYKHAQYGLFQSIDARLGAATINHEHKNARQSPVHPFIISFEANPTYEHDHLIICFNLQVLRSHRLAFDSIVFWFGMYLLYHLRRVVIYEGEDALFSKQSRRINSC